jgi:hypothetical protein
MANFVKSRAFLALLGGLSLFRLISIMLGIVGGRFLTVSWLLVTLTAVAQTIIFFGLLIRQSDLKFNQIGIQLAFLAGILGSFIIAMSDFINRRGSGIPLNPLELVFPVISLLFPILNFNHTQLYGFPLYGFWIPNLVIFYILFVAAIQITFKKDSNNELLPPIAPEISTSKESSVKKTMNNVATWTVRIPGQPENPVDTATLQNWAKTGFVRPDTMVTEVATGYAYQARQIPGVFSSKSYVTALLLSFFFGVFGVDRFYLGHVGVGLGKLFTFGGLGIWALIDFILIATKNIKDSQGVPLA